jgi:hypothetical protein
VDNNDDLWLSSNFWWNPGGHDGATEVNSYALFHDSVTTAGGSTNTDIGPDILIAFRDDGGGLTEVPLLWHTVSSVRYVSLASGATQVHISN